MQKAEQLTCSTVALMAFPMNLTGGVHCDQPFAKLGVSVSTAGDINNDGYADLMIAGMEYDPGGLVVVYYGGPTGPSTDAPVAGDPAVSIHLTGS